ncbi:MAG: hypothetical protein EOO44_09100 [Flavobacterium sp.]|nr:MAG: hypothetical protein EOO44_09100 [Flavobacterium sp.]
MNAKTKWVYLFILIVSLSSCISYQKFDYNKSDNNWVTAFKDNVFFASLKGSYQKDTIFQLIEKKDAFNPYDGLTIDDLNETIKLANEFVKNIPEPAMCENCKERENYYVANCLHYYESCELDWIAKEAYRKHLEIEKESISK